MEMSSPEAIKKLSEAGLGPSILPAAVVANEVRRGTLVADSHGEGPVLRVRSASS